MKKNSLSSINHYETILKMKNFSFLILISLLFSCADKKLSLGNTIFGKCDCEKTIKTDSVFFATDVELKKDFKHNQIVFKCATIETAIASVSDLDGNNERCENLYGIKCTSNNKEELGLKNDFAYFSDEMQNMDLTAEGTRQLFFEDLQSKEQIYFEFNLNKNREIIAISKLTVE